MTGALAIFAKTPGLSPVKTRLAADIGIENAEQFYRYSVKCLEELAFNVLRETQGTLVPYWAIGEENGLNDPLWENLDRLWTGDGGLGDRLNHVYAALLKKHDHVILIGTDSPQMSSGRIIGAHEILRKKRGMSSALRKMAVIIYTAATFLCPATCGSPFRTVFLRHAQFLLKNYSHMARYTIFQEPLTWISWRILKNYLPARAI